jgi:hypothetical protein
MADSSAVPSYDRNRATRDAPGRSGDRVGGDNTLMHGQYPPNPGNDIFGGTLPSGTGAPGSSGGGGGSDPTAMPGQTTEDIVGVPEGKITSTGSPGSSGAPADVDSSGNTSVSFTRPGSYLSGSYAQDTVRDDIGGPGDWTQANDSGYGSGGPQLPGIKGNEPEAGEGRFQPGGGRVLRGGRYHG